MIFYPCCLTMKRALDRELIFINKGVIYHFDEPVSTCPYCNKDVTYLQKDKEKAA